MSDLKLTRTGRECCRECVADGIVEFGGFCGNCWSGLSDKRRAVVLERIQPAKEVVTYRTVEYPPRQPFLAVAKFVWAALVTAAVAMLMYGRMR